MPRRRASRPSAWLAVALVAVVLAGGAAGARPNRPVLHEPVRPDPAEDLAMHVALDGELPAALRTSSGVVGAPDPRELPRPSEASYGVAADADGFTPDRDTKRPDVSGYDDPFTPSTAPFKRLSAFDAVRSDFRLYVRDERHVDVPSSALQGPDDDPFYVDLVADIEPSRGVRIPSVAAGARIVRAHLAVGAEDVPMRVKRDGADNWFLEAYRPKGPVRARLVMEVVAPRGAFGGALADPSWSDLPRPAALPENVAREAALVRSAVGVSRKMRPRAAVTKLVEYFRGFVDSEDAPRGRGSIYLDLALSKKGVCRHRAFAFLVTALGMGIPTRMVMNEAHAWVEVYDGVLWRRIDLGGAGRMTGQASEAMAPRTTYEAPPDGLPWPAGALRGGDLVTGSRGAAGGNEASSEGTTRASASSEANDGSEPAAQAQTPDPLAPPSPETSDERPASTIALSVAAGDAHSGQPLFVKGDVRAAGDGCPRVAVELWLRAAGTRKAFRLGTLATGEDGAFAGGVVVPVEMPLGDYDVIARTLGDARCGAGGGD
ncbi:MAG TPA: transglutaminase-like domain-containing protein [Polyangiaceae bacterium]|jgi:hypothetical protein